MVYSGVSHGPNIATFGFVASFRASVALCFSGIKDLNPLISSFYPFHLCYVDVTELDRLDSLTVMLCEQIKHDFTSSGEL